MPYNITDTNDIFLFFEIIDRTEPASIIDIGMFLDRIGAVSRNVKDKRIPDESNLDALRGKGASGLKIYSRIYDDILEELPNKNYDIAMMLRPEAVFEATMADAIVEWLPSHVKYLLTERSFYEKKKKLHHNRDAKSLSSESKEYRLILF